MLSFEIRLTMLDLYCVVIMQSAVEVNRYQLHPQTLAQDRQSRRQQPHQPRLKHSKQYLALSLSQYLHRRYGSCVISALRCVLLVLVCMGNRESMTYEYAVQVSQPVRHFISLFTLLIYGMAENLRCFWYYI